MEFCKTKKVNCTNIEGLLAFEVEVIKQYSFRGDLINFEHFFNTYAELMRESYCGGECSLRYDCQIAEKYLTGTSYSGRE